MPVTVALPVAVGVAQLEAEPVALTVPLRVGNHTEGDAVLLRVGVAVGVSVTDAEPLAVADAGDVGDALVDAEGVPLIEERDVEEGEPDEVGEGDAVHVRVDVDVAVLVAVAVKVSAAGRCRRGMAPAARSDVATMGGETARRGVEKKKDEED